MKNLLQAAILVLVALLISLPVQGQDRSARPAGGDTGGSSSSIASRGIATTTTTVTPSAPVAVRDYSTSSGSHIASNPVATGGSGGGYVPDLHTSSFNSINNYYQWQDFFWYLQTRYYMNSAYFGRFYRNREPLVTPELLKLTVRQPLKLSTQMLAAVDELESMIKERDAGKPVDRQTIAAKSQEIRDLAKKIRQDQSLAFFDQRRDKDMVKGDQVDNLGLEAVARLREMATDLNTQLKSMYTQSQPSTISVQSLTAPSFESLTKGIDRLTKVIENSARRM